MVKETTHLLDALNAYAHKMRLAEIKQPIVFRKERDNDVLISDSFKSGDHFALTGNGEFVYRDEQVGRNLNCLYFILSKEDLDKAEAYHKDIKSKMQSEAKYLNEIQGRTTIILQQLNTIIDEA